MGKQWELAAGILRAEMARRAPRMTQAQMAELTGISQPQVSKYLRAAASPNLDEVEAMCAALGLVGDEVWRQARIYDSVGPAERADLDAAIRRTSSGATPASPITKDNLGQTGT